MCSISSFVTYRVAVKPQSRSQVMCFVFACARIAKNNRESFALSLSLLTFNFSFFQTSVSVRAGYSILRLVWDSTGIRKPPPGHVLYSLLPHRERTFCSVFDALVQELISTFATAKFVYYPSGSMHIYLCNLSSKMFHVPSFERVAKQYLKIEKKRKPREMEQFIRYRLKKVTEIEKVCVVCFTFGWTGPDFVRS